MGVAPLPVFLFGTLRDLDLLEIVAGDPQDWRDADLPDHRVAVAKGESFPILTQCAGRAARGLLISPGPAQLARLDFYEAPYGYTRQPVRVCVEDEIVDAETYRPEAELWEPGDDWSLERWQRDHGPLMREAAGEIMDEMGRVAPELIAKRFGVIRTRAQQRLNAHAVSSPVVLRQPHSREDVQLDAKRTPYSHFFTLQELDVRARRFTGEMSETMERAVFVAADAVTVLPYDPLRDHVLLIEQFRPGCYLRGDPCPWSLEAIAGRQDPGESHEETARREALEEAGLEIGALYRAGSYYSSPGTNTEYLTSYIGLADLPESAAGIGGLESEAEDIRSMVVPFDQLMDAVQSGEVENGPLLISALWLAANRERLRRQA